MKVFASSGGTGGGCEYDGFRRLEPLPDGPSQATHLSATTSESRVGTDV